MNSLATNKKKYVVKICFKRLHNGMEIKFVVWKQKKKAKKISKPEKQGKILFLYWIEFFYVFVLLFFQPLFHKMSRYKGVFNGRQYFTPITRQKAFCCAILVVPRIHIMFMY